MIYCQKCTALIVCSTHECLSGMHAAKTDDWNAGGLSGGRGKEACPQVERYLDWNSTFTLPIDQHQALKEIK